MRPRIILPIIFSIFFIVINNTLIAQRTKSSINAGEQRSSEKGLKDNRYFFYFINSTISNFGDLDNSALYRQAIQRDIISQILYMKFVFHESYMEIRKAQEILINIYQKTALQEIEATKKLLDDFAPDVIKSNKYLSRHYLELGYKNLVVSKQLMIMSDNYQNTLYSLRLYQYVKSIKKAKLGKRYAILSLLSVKLDKKSAIIDNKHYNFEELERLIGKLDSDNKNNLLIIHYDNYYKVKNKISFYDKIWMQPDLHEIKEYKEYLKQK